ANPQSFQSHAAKADLFFLSFPVKIFSMMNGGFRLFDKCKYFLFSKIFCRTGFKFAGQLLPKFEQGVPDSLKVLFFFSFGQSVRFCVNQNKRNSFFSKPVNKLNINLLWWNIGVN